jgi:uncharacterized protein (TIGR02145 family)
MKSPKRILISLMLLLLNSSISTAYMYDDQTVKITASGSGSTAIEARNVALRSAVEQAYGVFVSSKTEILNDALIADEIITVSSGNVQSFEVLSEIMFDDNRYSVTLNAMVSVGKLISYAQSKGQEVEFSGGIFAFNIRQQQLNESNELKAIQEIVPIFHSLASQTFNYNISYTPPVQVPRTDFWDVKVDVDIESNSNLMEIHKLISGVLKGVSLSIQEAAVYGSLNKNVFPYTIIFPENDQVSYSILRNPRSLTVLNSMYGLISSYYIYHFEVEYDGGLIRLNKRNQSTPRPLKYANMELPTPTNNSSMNWFIPEAYAHYEYDYPATNWVSIYPFMQDVIDTVGIDIFLRELINYDSSVINDCGRQTNYYSRLFDKRNKVRARYDYSEMNLPDNFVHDYKSYNIICGLRPWANNNSFVLSRNTLSISTRRLDPEQIYLGVPLSKWCDITKERRPRLICNYLKVSETPESTVLRLGHIVEAKPLKHRMTFHHILTLSQLSALNGYKVSPRNDFGTESNFQLLSASCKSGVTDIDGNTYETVQIGGQCWMAENLRTSRFNDGTKLANDVNFAHAKKPSWSNYAGLTADSTHFGKLYNTAAVHNERYVCPVGWRIPEENDFITLWTRFRNSDRPQRLISDKWRYPQYSAENSSGLDLVPSGLIQLQGYGTVQENSIGRGTHGYYWIKDYGYFGVRAARNGRIQSIVNDDDDYEYQVMSRTEKYLAIRCIKSSNGN